MEPLDVAQAVLRVAAGLVMLAHGVNHAGGRERTTKWFAGLGFRQPQLQWFLVTSLEVVVGVLLVVGLLTGLAAAGVASIMFVAFWTVHRHNGFFTFRPGEGWEYVAVLATVALVIAMSGPGELSIDHALGIADDLDGWVGAALTVAGILAGAFQLAVFYRPSTAAEG